MISNVCRALLTASSILPSFPRAVRFLYAKPEYLQKVASVVVTPINYLKTFCEENSLIVNQAVQEIYYNSSRYYPLSEEEVKVGCNNERIGDFFKKTLDADNPWDICQYSFDPKNIDDLQKLLTTIYETIEDPIIMQAMSAQVLTKLVMSHKAHVIKVGDTLHIPTLDSLGNRHCVEYTFVKKFNVWQGIPAFGLADKNNQFPPILLFRPTNTNYNDIDMLPTIFANLHPAGPAWDLFKKSRYEISDWLEGQNKQSTEKARVMGFSQGGILASYFLAHYSHHFNTNEWAPSIILDAPGVSARVEEIWDAIEQKPNVQMYINRGDIVPKVGKAFIGKVFEVDSCQKSASVAAHCSLSLFAPKWKIVEISNDHEKKSLTRKIFSAVHEALGQTIQCFTGDILLF